MEALAAFGIACNVIQVISFTRETIAICKEVYSSGTLLDHDGYVNKVVSQHEGLCRELNTKLKDEGAVFDPDEKELLEIAQDCLAASTKLKDAASKLVSPSVKGNAFRSLYSGVSARWKEGRLQKLEVEVNKHQARLEYQLLMKVCKRTDAMAIQQNDIFTSLDGTLRMFIANIAQGEQSIKDLMVSQEASMRLHYTEVAAAQARTLKEHITSEMLTTRQLIASGVNKSQPKADVTAFRLKKQKYERLLESLESEGLQERRSQVAASHDGTFEWIFDSEKWKASRTQPILPRTSPVSSSTQNGHTQSNTVKSDHTCGPASTATFDCFPCWLAERSARPYWLCGKAGSGKSTLVKFLTNHKKTKTLLVESHGPVLVLSHFFWLSGSPKQRNLHGAVLSLLNQFLQQAEAENDAGSAWTRSEEEECPWSQKAAKIILEAIPDASYKVSTEDWSYDELCDAFVALLKARSAAACIFLDGLDEADSEMQTATPKPVLGLVDRLCRIPQVKVCASSRPEPAFQLRFSQAPQLLLQHLTRDDIRAYVVNSIESQLPSHESGVVGGLADKVCQYSDGVFIWVRLVTRSLIRGLMNGDTLSQMHERLEMLPRDINKLYQSMWQRMDEEGQKIYHQEAALYINLALDGFRLPSSHFSGAPPFSPSDLQLYAATNPAEIRRIFADPQCQTYDAIQSQCIKFGKRLEIVTAGLLELTPIVRPFRANVIGFIHRSAKEFFANTVEGKALLAIDESGISWRRARLLEGILFTKWLYWYSLPPSSKKAMSLSEIEKFAKILDEAFVAGHMDRGEQFSLLHLAEQAYHASARISGQCTKPFEWKYYWEDIFSLAPNFDFNRVLFQLGDRYILENFLGVGFNSPRDIARAADGSESRKRLPLVYSQAYKASILHVLLSPKSYGRTNLSFFVQRNHDCILWMLDQGISDNWPQGKAAAGPMPGLAGLAAMALLRNARDDVEWICRLSILQRCLLLDGAWDDKPLFALEEYVPRTGPCVYTETPVVGQFTLDDYDADYLLSVQAAVPFIILAGLDKMHTNDKTALIAAQDLKDEVWRRYPDGPPPAEIFMLRWSSNPKNGTKGDYGFVDVSGMSWTSLSLSQFSLLMGPGSLSPVQDSVLALNMEDCVKYTSVDEVDQVLLKRMEGNFKSM